MKVYIQAKKGLPTDQDHFNAYIGFKEMGTEIIFFESYEELLKSNMVLCQDLAQNKMRSSTS